MQHKEKRFWTLKPSWQVAVLYEDAATQQDAVAYCDSLVNRFWESTSFNFGWWPLEQAHDFRAAQQASQALVEADLIVFAIHPGDNLESRIAEWLHHCLCRRNHREGLVVGIGDPAANSDEDSPKHIALRHLAHNAGLDYLTELPHTLATPLPDSAEFYHDRARQVSGVLSEILRRPHRTAYGIP